MISGQASYALSVSLALLDPVGGGDQEVGQVHIRVVAVRIPRRDLRAQSRLGIRLK